MKYLLDINALLAWEHANSPHHISFHSWAKKTGRANWWMCGHTELGFIRVSMQVFGYSLTQASEALREMKQHSGGFIKVAPPPRLAAWAATAARTSDAYLAQIARENEMKMATFDTAIDDEAVELIGRS